MNSEMDNYGAGSSRLLIGMLVGAAVGAAIGLAFAPYSGVETRRRITESGQKFKKSAARGYERASANVSQMLDQGREAVARGQQAFERARNEATEIQGAS